jgi:hypothetical protein
MPARNIYHDAVVAALVADGWTITDDPLYIGFGGRNFFVDLGAEQTLGAEKEGRRIAVEIQSFIGPSDVDNLEHALGQYLLYTTALTRREPDRRLYMAVHRSVANTLFKEEVGRAVVADWKVRLLVFDEVTQRVIEWIE